ncbi:MAG: aldehyde ferredoxin oxidoreductase family protein [Candidatus Jordarchaeum sp.]|uniref:aldehyde ferredoxin oxidoreductase family protein n=1 Tax=Candidatus Jordarchaeum sp. TaxID=2823881 RepID=UPI00404B21CE
MNSILRIDLSRDKISEERPVNEWAIKYIGGRGWGARRVWEEVEVDINPLGPDNLLFFSSGPLTGLLVPSAGKLSIVSISPATRIYADSSVGGAFGAELKQAGYDAIALKGISKKPVYIMIDNGAVEIRDAGEYWGAGALVTEERLKRDLGDNGIHVMAIGPAGENLVKFACITSDYGRNAGRTGMGAIMGSKKVKAIVVRGFKDIPIANVDQFMEIAYDSYRKISENQFLDIWQRQGTLQVIEWANERGVLPTRNFQETHFEEAEEIGGDKMEEVKTTDRACFACPMTCGNYCVIQDGDTKVAVEGPEYETAAMLGSVCGIRDLKTVIKANNLCDDLGIDTISSGNLVGLLMEAYEKGIITREDTGGIELKFGNGEALLKVLEMIARREGIGDIVAEGVKAVMEKWKGTKPFAMQIKGLEQSAYDTRASPGMALAYATCDVGAHHSRAWVIAKDLEMRDKWTSEDRAKLVIYHQHIRPLFDCLGVCRLEWIELSMDENIYADFYSAVTGIKTALKELLKRSEAIYNLTRAINVVRGITRMDDYPPERVFCDPIPSGSLKGKLLQRDEYDELLDTYYRLRGWNKKGIPTKETLIRLELEDVALSLEKLGKL